MMKLLRRLFWRSWDFDTCAGYPGNVKDHYVHHRSKWLFMKHIVCWWEKV